MKDGKENMEIMKALRKEGKRHSNGCKKYVRKGKSIQEIAELTGLKIKEIGPCRMGILVHDPQSGDVITVLGISTFLGNAIKQAASAQVLDPIFSVVEILKF